MLDKLRDFKQLDLARCQGKSAKCLVNSTEIKSVAPPGFQDLVDLADYVKCGQNAYIFKITSQDYSNCVLKLIPYQFADMYSLDWYYYNLNIKNPIRCENVEVLQTNHLQNLLLNNPNYPNAVICPHLSLPLTSFRTSWNSPEIKSLVEKIEIASPTDCDKIKDNYLDMERIEMSQENNPDHEILVFISEYSQYGDVYKWLTKQQPSLADFKIFLFQLIYTFACLEHLDPSFRHNDLSMSNILVQNQEETSDNPNSFHHYHFRGQDFLIPVTTFSLRLWDFDFSNSQTVPNRKVFCGPSQDSYFNNEYECRENDCREDFYSFSDYGVSGKPCPQYDLHFFFSDLKNYTDYYDDIPKNDPVKKYIQSWTDFTNSDRPGIVHEDRLTTKAQLKHLDPVEQQVIAKKKRLITTYHEDGTNKNIPYYQYTPAYSLTHCDLFKSFLVTPEMLKTTDDKGLILAHYVLS